MPIRETPAPERPEGISLGDATRRFGIHAKMIYAAERAGHLIGMRIGNRVYYSAAQLETLFGSPGPDWATSPQASAA